MDSNLSKIINNEEIQKSGISSIMIYSLCLILVLYLSMNIMSNTNSENKILGLNLVPENLSVNLVKGLFILIVYLLAKEPQNILKGHFGAVFGASMASLVYFIFLSLGKMNKIGITQDDIDNGKENQKSAMYWTLYIIGCIISIVAIIMSLWQTKETYGSKQVGIQFIILIGFILVFIGIILTRNKENTEVDLNIGFISLLTLFFTSNPKNSGMLNFLQIMLINIFLFYTFIFGNIMPLSSKGNSLGDKVKNYCKNILNKKNEYKKESRSITELKQEINDLKNSSILKNKERINNIQWIMTALSICIMVAVISFLFMYQKNE